MTELLRRAGSFADLEIRSDGRTVVGLAVPFNAATEIGSPMGTYVETFRAGAFARTIAERGDRVKFLALHNDQQMPLGRATVLREEARGLVAELRVSKTAAGDEALALINDGALDALSIGFTPVRDQWTSDRSSVDRLEVRLHEISIVNAGAYAGARVLAVRSETPTGPPADFDAEVWAARLHLPHHTINAWAARLGIINA